MAAPTKVKDHLLIDEELEREILGACFQEDRTVIGDVRQILGAHDFVLQTNQRIFRALCHLADTGEPLSWSTAAQYLRIVNTPIDLGVLIEYSPQWTWALQKNLQRAKRLSARRRWVDAAEHMRLQSGDPSLDLRDCLESARALMQSVEDGSQVEQPVETPEEIIASLGGLDGFFNPRLGIQTPWAQFNEVTGGWNPGELAIIAARASMGKTSFAINAVYHAALRRVPCVFYSCEMNQEQILKRMVSLVTGIPFGDLQHGNLIATERHAAASALGAVADLPIRIVAAAGKTAGAIRNHVERLNKKKLCDLVVIDYIGLIRGSDRNSDNRAHELGDIARQLKLLAAELNVAVIVLAQLNRSVESRTDKHPTMSDLRDSGELEEHGDLIALLFRPDYYNRDEPAIRGTAEVIVAKQRNGPTPVIPLRFDHHNGKFHDPPQKEDSDSHDRFR